MYKIHIKLLKVIVNVMSVFMLKKISAIFAMQTGKHALKIANSVCLVIQTTRWIKIIIVLARKISKFEIKTSVLYAKLVVIRKFMKSIDLTI